MTGRAVLDRQVHDLADLLGVGLGERAAEDGEVLGEDVDQPAVDRAVAADDSVARDLLALHAEVGAAVGDEGVDLHEGAGVEQQLDALAGGELARRVLLADAVLPAPAPGRGEPAAEVFDRLGPYGHRRRSLSQACTTIAPMPFSELDTAAVARTLSQIADQPEDVVDAFFERREETELPPEDEGPGLRVRREEGFAIRLSREGHTWLAARDVIDARPFAEALRQVARALPSATYPEPAFRLPPFEPDPRTAPELIGVPEALTRALRSHHVGFPARVTVRKHRRWLQVVGPRLVAGQESESFYSLQVETAWGTPRSPLPAARLRRHRKLRVLPGRTSSAPGRRPRPSRSAAPRSSPRPRWPCCSTRRSPMPWKPTCWPRGETRRRRSGWPWPPPRSTCSTIPPRRPRACGGPRTTRARPYPAAGSCAGASWSSPWPISSGRAPRRCSSQERDGAAPGISLRVRGRATWSCCPERPWTMTSCAAPTAVSISRRRAAAALDPLSGEFRPPSPLRPPLPPRSPGRHGRPLRAPREGGRPPHPRDRGRPRGPLGGRGLVRQGGPEDAGLGHGAGAAPGRSRDPSRRRPRLTTMTSAAPLLEEVLRRAPAARPSRRGGLRQAGPLPPSGDHPVHREPRSFSQEQGWAVRAGDPRRSFFAAGTGEPARDGPWPEPTGRPIRLPEPSSPQAWNEPSDFDAPLMGEREGLKLLESLGRELASELPGARLLRAALEDGSSESEILATAGACAPASATGSSTLYLEASGPGRPAPSASVYLSAREARRFHPTALARRLADRLAVSAQGAPPDRDRGELLLAPPVVARLLCGLLPLLVGPRASGLRDRRGRIGSERLTLIDNGRLAWRSPGSPGGRRGGAYPGGGAGGGGGLPRSRSSPGGRPSRIREVGRPPAARAARAGATYRCRDPPISI